MGDEKSTTTATSAEVELAEATRFQRDLYLYWREVQLANGLPLTTRGYLTRSALRRILQRLASADGAHDAASAQERAETDHLRLFFLRRLLQRMNLLHTAPDAAKLLAADSASMARYLAHPLAERLRICARLWVAGGWWPDAPDPHAPLPRLMSPAPPRLALARRRLLEQLARVTGATNDAPAPLSALAANRRAAGVAKSVPARSASPRRRVAQAGREDEIWLAALSGPLLWMGFVQQQTHQDDAGATMPAFQGYTATSATYALRDAEDEATRTKLAETPGRVIVQPNFEVIALPPLTAPILWLLDSCAEGTLDQTARYRLTRQTVAAAYRQGWSAATLSAQLEAVTTAPLPANVRITLDDWERHVERVRLLRDVQLLEVREAALLDTLLADRALASLVERRLTPTAALLAPDALPRVRSWLLRQGELPALIQ
jgi:hypothetical protein